MDKQNIPQLMTPEKSAVTVPYCDITVSDEVSEEISLADYYPEVRRIVSVSARVIPEGKFMSGNTVECDGAVSFIVTYLGEDRTLAAVPFTVAYSVPVELPECPENALPGEIYTDCTVDSSGARATDARKLSLKAHLKVRVFGDMRIKTDEKYSDENGQKPGAEDTLSLEKLSEKHTTVRRFSGAANGEVGGMLRTNGSVKPLSADAAINIIDAHTADGKIKVRAEAVVFVQCVGEDGLYVMLRAKEPFEEEIDVPSAQSGDAACACGRAVSVSVTQEDGGLSYTVEYDIEGECMKPEEVSLCTDVYSTSYDTQETFGEFEMYAPIKCSVLHLTASGGVKRRSASSAGEYVTGMSADAVCEKIDFSDGRMTLTGSVGMQAAIAGDGEVYPEEGKFPFTVSADIPETDISDPVWHANVSVVDVGARPGDKEIEASAELSISVFALDRRKVKCVGNVVIDHSKPKKHDSALKIYFPETGERVWDIAKKYSSCRQTLCSLNGWSEETAAVGDGPVVIG